MATEQFTCEDHNLELPNKPRGADESLCGAEQLTCEEHSLELAHEAQLEQMTTEEHRAAYL